MAFSIRLSEEERRLAESYARIHSFSLAEAFKKALFEKIEDEYDISIAESAYQEYLSNPVTYSHEEAWGEIQNELRGTLHRQSGERTEKAR